MLKILKYRWLILIQLKYNRTKSEPEEQELHCISISTNISHKIKFNFKFYSCSKRWIICSSLHQTSEMDEHCVQLNWTKNVVGIKFILHVNYLLNNTVF